MPQQQAKPNKRMSIPLMYGAVYSAFGGEMPVGGMNSSGDAGAIPRSDLRSLSNMLPLPNRLQVRPPFVYDTLMSINGLCNFDDQTNKVSRLVSVDASHHVYTKATSGETWSAANATTISGTRVTDYTNYRGKMYAMVDNGSGLPSGAFSYDGTTITTSPFNSAIQARTVTAFNDRLFFGYPRVTVMATGGSATVIPDTLDAHCYDFTNVRWSGTNVTATNITSGTNTICQLYPTSTTASSIYYSRTVSGDRLGLGAVDITSDTTRSVVLLMQLKNLHASYNMPITIRALMITNWRANTAYGAGIIVNGGTDAAGSIQRLTTAGTTGAVAPTWNTTVGATTVDNTATWTCEKADNIMAQLETVIPNATTARDFTSFYLPIPSLDNVAGVGVAVTAQLCFFNTANPTITLAPIQVSLKDGLTDGDPRKANRGCQLTQGDFYYPFFNQESSATATVDMQQIVWSEIAQPKQIRAVNTWNPWETPGYVTAACSIGGRYLAFKRNALWVFQGTSDADNPIQREAHLKNIGCLGSLAIDTFEDTVYFICDNEIYSYRVGEATPTPLCGDGMREEILNKGSNWVESQSTYKRPLLVIDKTRLLVWVYTQKAVLYCYDIRSQKWSKHTTPNSAEVDALIYNSNTGEVYAAFASATYGLSRLDYTLTQNDTIDNTVNTYAVSADVVFHPIELYDPPRFDATLEDIQFFHAATASQTSQTVTASYSLDQGMTYSRNDVVTLSPLSISGEYIPVRLNALQTAPSITVKLNHTGKAGASAWTISQRVYANVNIRRGEYIQGNQSLPSSNLVQP